MADKQFAPLYEIADQFISQANTLAESKDLATLVSTATRRRPVRGVRGVAAHR